MISGNTDWKFDSPISNRPCKSEFSSLPELDQHLKHTIEAENATFACLFSLCRKSKFSHDHRNVQALESHMRNQHDVDSLAHFLKSENMTCDMITVQSRNDTVKSETQHVMIF